MRAFGRYRNAWVVLLLAVAVKFEQILILITKAYEPYRAHQISHQRLKRPKTPKILANPVMSALVEKYLKMHWSPAQISGRLKKMYPPMMSRCTYAAKLYIKLSMFMPALADNSMSTKYYDLAEQNADHVI